MRFILLCCFVVLLTACQVGNTSTEESTPSEKEPDVVLSSEADHDKNLSRLDTFVDSINQGNKDDILIMTYTYEGDPIYHTLNYDEDNIHYEIDQSEDKYGRVDSENNTAVCENFDRETTENGVKYALSDCSNELAENFEFEIIP